MTVETQKMIQLPCIRCGEANANIDIRIHAGEDGEEIYCCECDTAYSIADIEEFMEAVTSRWGKMLPKVKALFADD